MLDDLALFVQIVRAGSFAKASRALGIPANTLSRRLMSLERSLGTALFLRSTRLLRCTADGERLYQKCKSSIDHLGNALATLRDDAQGIVGQVRIQVPTGFFECQENGFFSQLLRQHPGLELDVVVADHEPDLVLDGLDLLFFLGELKNDAYVVRKLFDLELGLYASPGYLAMHGVPERVEDLAEHACLHLKHAQGFELHSSCGRKTYRLRSGGRLTTTSSSALLNAAINDTGVALLSTLVAEWRKEQLVRILPDYAVRGRALHAAYSSHRTLSACARAVLDFAVATVQQACDLVQANHA
ncbi:MULTISPECIES: LysR family transcriptional regulator [Pseudomonadaceae]|uniref:LysR family transcriptional regulator n=1 Tax=Pseudomonadaceae TaxID=135621 RepID=UPI001112CD54|nr:MULTISPECIES: LysR family transcriptional regulator [Pseudomonas]